MMLHRKSKKRENRETYPRIAEYDAAMDEQRDTAAQIEKLENLIKNAEIITGGELGSGKVNIGCTVKVYDVDFDEEMEFKLVGSTEANSSLKTKFSNGITCRKSSYWCNSRVFRSGRDRSRYY